MTVPLSTYKKRYAGTGARLSFPYPWKIFADSELAVYIRDAQNVDTLQVLDADYTVTDAGEVGGGDVVFGTAPLSTDIVIVVRSTPLVQETDYESGGAFSSASHEDALDYLMMAVQTLQEKIDRAIKFGRGTPQSDVPMPEPVANALLRWNAAATAIENYVSTVTVSVPVFKSIADYDDLADMVTTIGASTAFVVIHQAVTATSLTIPANITLFVTSEGMITVPAGVTVQCNGSFMAGSYKCLNIQGSGLWLFGPGSCPEQLVTWYGATGDDTTDDTAAWQVALDNISPAANKVRKLTVPDAAGYRIGGTGMTIAASVDSLLIEGSQRYGACFKKHATWVDGSGLFNLQGTTGNEIQHVHFERLRWYEADGDTDAWDVIPVKAAYSWNMVVRDCHLNCIKHWLDLEKCDDFLAEDNKAYACGAIASTTALIYATGERSGVSPAPAAGMRLLHNTIERTYGREAIFDNAGSVKITGNKLHGRTTTDDDPNESIGVACYGGANYQITENTFAHHRGGDDLYFDDVSGVSPVAAADRVSAIISNNYFDGSSRTYSGDTGLRYGVNWNAGAQYSALTLEGNRFAYIADGTNCIYLHLGANVNEITYGCLAIGINHFLVKTAACVIQDDQADPLHSIRPDPFGIAVGYGTALPTNLDSLRIGDLRVYAILANGTNPARKSVMARVAGGYTIGMGGFQGPLTFSKAGAISNGDILGAWNWNAGNDGTEQIVARIEQIDVLCLTPPGETSDSHCWKVVVADAAAVLSSEEIFLLDAHADTVRHNVGGTARLYTKQAGFGVNWGNAGIPYLYAEKVGSPTGDPSTMVVTIWYTLRQM